MQQWLLPSATSQVRGHVEEALLLATGESIQNMVNLGRCLLYGWVQGLMSIMQFLQAPPCVFTFNMA